ncbi:MAG: PaaI family thioesterase [Bacteroidetes bacterium]|nr:PaaI family thioesterase [Bacteroidota bacterium]
MTQGGIVATILDSAMVQLLHDLLGSSPVTARLDVRYLNTTPLRRPLTVKARMTKQRGNMCWAEAEIIEATDRCATASGVFRVFCQEPPNHQS